MKNNVWSLVVALGLVCSVAQAAPELKNDDDRTLYTLGVKAMMDLAPFQLSARELAIVIRGMRDTQKGELALDPNQYRARIAALADARVKKRAETERKRGQAYIEAAKKKPGARVSGSGLVWFQVRAGKGPKPGTNHVVKVHYRGTLIDGTEFDSTLKGKPAEFPLDRVIPCWTDAFTQMELGTKAKLVCPAEIAYGNRGAAPVIPPGATLVFEVELLERKMKK